MGTIIGPSGIQDGSGSSGSSGGGGGVVSKTYNIPGDFATLTAAFAYLDANGGVAGGNFVEFQLASSAGTPLTETFDWTDKDYSKVSIKGADAVSSMITGWGTLSGTLPNYSLTLTVAPEVAAAAAIAGYLLIECGFAQNDVQRCKTPGYWKVTATTSTTVTVTINSMVAFTTPTFASGLYRATVFPTVFKVADSSKPWMKLLRSKSPVLKNLGVIGAVGDAGFASNVQHAALYVLTRSEFTTAEDPTGTLTDQGIFLGIHGFASGIYTTGTGLLTGAISVSNCWNTGVVMASKCEFAFNPLNSTGNGRSGSGNGIIVYNLGEGTLEGFQLTALKASNFGGNAGYGIGCDLVSSITMRQGSSGGNGSTDILAQNDAHVSLGTTVFTGTVSPAVNTLGNSNSYIRKP